MELSSLCSLQHVRVNWTYWFEYRADEFEVSYPSFFKLRYAKTYLRVLSFTLQVHGPNTRPDPFTYGQSLKPGTFTKLSLEAKYKSLLPEPYGTNCNDDVEKSNQYRYVIESWR